MFGKARRHLQRISDGWLRDGHDAECIHAAAMANVFSLVHYGVAAFGMGLLAR